MTQHEMLLLVGLAEEWHAQPVSEGGHGEPLTMPCFLAFLSRHDRLLGFPASYLHTQFQSRFNRLTTNGWIDTWKGTCGQDHFALTEKGVAQLNEWNEKGCLSHRQRRGRERCAAPQLPQLRKVA